MYVVQQKGVFFDKIHDNNCKLVLTECSTLPSFSSTILKRIEGLQYPPFSKIMFKQTEEF